MIRFLTASALTATLAACASARPSEAIRHGQPVLPTEQFTATAEAAPEQILLGPHANGLSPNQAQALARLVGRWRDDGDGPIVVSAPSTGGEAAYRTVQSAQAALLGMGLTLDQVRTASYQAQGPDAPIQVSYLAYQADIPHCGRKWESFTHSGSNEVNSNFGCAVTANFAAMVANPADLDHPREMTPADAQRREYILNKYRQGQTTSSTKDDQANGAISQAVK